MRSNMVSSINNDVKHVIQTNLSVLTEQNCFLLLTAISRINEPITGALLLYFNVFLMVVPNVVTKCPRFVPILLNV